jgi:hypothetical protein
MQANNGECSVYELVMGRSRLHIILALYLKVPRARTFCSLAAGIPARSSRIQDNCRDFVMVDSVMRGLVILHCGTGQT